MLPFRQSVVTVAWLVALSAVPRAAAQTMYVAPVTQDTYLDESTPDVSYQSATDLRTWAFLNSFRIPMIEFDLSAISPAQTVTSATLMLYTTKPGNSSSMNVYRITSAWDKGAATWNTTASNVDLGTSWASFTPAVSGTTLVDVTSLVQAWVDGTYQNHGLRIHAGASTQDTWFASNNALSAGSRPSLTVTTTTGPPAPFDIRTGTYTGNGTADRKFTGLGFSPSVVIVKGDNSDQATMKTDTMPTTESKPLGTSDPLVTTRITALDADGFTVGADNSVNESGKEFHWVAMLADDTVLATGSYVGDYTDSRSITTGFPPDFVTLLPASGYEGLHRFPAQQVNKCFSFSAGTELNNRIEDFTGTGFLVGNNIGSNETGTVFHWVAAMSDGTSYTTSNYTGSGTTDRLIVAGLAPQFTFIRTKGNSDGAVFRTDKMAPDYTLPVFPSGAFSEGIKTLEPTGFTVGSDNAVNKSGTDNFWLAFRSPSSADLVVNASVDDSTAVPSQALTFTVAVGNAGPDSATGVVITDLLPAGLTYQFATPSQGSYVSGTGAWNVGTIPAAGFATLGITANVVAEPQVSSLYNAAAVTQVNQPDPNPGSEADSVLVTIAGTDLSVVTGVDQPAPAEGDSLLLTVSLTNNGAGQASSIQVAGALPTGLTAVGDSVSSGSYNPVLQTWDIGKTLLEGQTESLWIGCVVDSGTAGSTLTYSSGITGSSRPDPAASNNSDSVSVSVPAADIAVSKTVDDPSPAEGDTVTFTIDVVNLGPADGTTIRIQDLLPAGLTYVADSASQGAYTSGSGLWTLGTLVAGDSASIDIQASVDGGTTGSVITNGAALSSVTPSDPNPANDADSAAVTIRSADLALSVSASDTTPGEGQTITLSVELANAGPDSAGSVSVTDAVPSGLSFVSAVASAGTYLQPSGLWTVGAVAAGDTVTLAVITTVNPGEAGNALNYLASVTGTDTADPNGANNGDGVALNVTASDIVIGSSVSDPAPVAGDSVTVTITLGNNGPDAAGAVVVNYLPPAGLTYGSHTAGAGTYNSGSGAWSLGGMPSGLFTSLDVTLAVDPGTEGGVFTNAASVASAGLSDPDTTNNSTSVDVTVQSADLGLALSVDAPAPNEGDTVTFTLTVTNAGPDSVNSVALTDSLPAGLSYVSDVADQGTYDSGTGIWDVGTLPSGGVAQVLIDATVDPGTAGASLTNTAYVSGGVPGDPNSANDTTSVQILVPAADLGVTKTANRGSANVGSSVTYTVKVNNAGPDSATSVVLTDLLPTTQVTYQSSAPTQGSYNDITGLWDVGAVAAGDSATLSITVTVDPGTELQTVTNTATLTGADQADPNALNNSDGASFLVLGAVTIERADVAVTKTAGIGTPDVGDAVVFSIEATNFGPDPANAMEITDLLPSGLLYVSETLSQGTYTPGTGVWNAGTIAVGDTVTMDLTAQIGPGTAGNTIINTATVTSAGQTDNTGSNNADSDSVTVQAADIRVSQTADNLRPDENDTVRFTVNVTNAGPQSGTGLQLTELLPAGLTYQSDSPEQGTYASGTGVWDIGGIAAGDTLTLDLFASVDPGTAGQAIDVVAAVTASGRGDPVTADNADTTSLVVTDVDIAVTLAATDSTADEGDSVLFTVLAKNLGADPAVTVQVVDLLPAGLSLAADSVSQGTYTAVSGTWEIGGVAAGDSATLRLTGTVDPGTAGQTLLNNATLTAADPYDHNPANDTDSASLSVRSADLDVTVTVDDPAAPAGSAVQLTTVVANAGPDSTDGVTLLEVLPSGLSYVTHVDSTGTWADSTGIWTLGALAAGDSASLVITASVNPGTAGTIQSTTASVTGSRVADPNAANDTDTATINVPAGITVTAVQSSRLANPGEADVAVLTMSVANSHVYSATLDQARFTNTSLGPGSQAELDASFGTLTLYQDDGDLIFEPRSDPVLGTTIMAGGAATFGGLSVTMPPGSIGAFHLGATLGLAARDGDHLDVSLTDAGALSFQEAVTHLSAWPLAPAGRITVDGVAAAQISAIPLGTTSIVAGSTDTPVFHVTIPPNGYATDTLNEIHLANGGDAAAVTDIAAVAAWVDDGNGIFDRSSAADALLGAMTWSGTSWDLTGLSTPIPVAGVSVFFTVDAALTATAGRTIQLELPTSPAGLIVASSNDGPVDAPATAADVITIQAAPTVVSVSGRQTPATLFPDGTGGHPILTLDLVNTGAKPETLDTVTFTDATIGPGAPADLDASWANATLSLASRADISGVGRAAPVTGGLVAFSKLGAEIAAGDTLTVTLLAGASTVARDGDTLDMTVSDPARITFEDSTVVVTAAAWPVAPPGGFPVDGMVSAQAPVDSNRLPPNLLTGALNEVAFIAALPANGYEADTLQELNVVNLGTAQDGIDIERMDLWVDVDGDGVPEPEGDDAAGLVGPMVFTGARWEMTGLSVPLPVPSRTLFLTVNVAAQATVGATVQLAIPLDGAGVASANDGPLDAALAGTAVQTISTSDRVSLSATQVPPGTAAPGEAGVVLLHLSVTNDYTVGKTLTDLTVTNAGTGAGLPADLDTEAGLLTLHPDSPDSAGVASAIFSASTASFTGFSQTLAPAETRSFFVTARVSPTLAADGDVLSASVAGDADVGFSDATTLVATWPVTSGAQCVIDGMIAAQIGMNVAPPATLGPGEGPALALDLVIPSNGYLPDVLQGVTVVNGGTAVAGDIDQMRLWADGGDGAFDEALGDDTDLGPMTPIGGAWTSPALSDSVPAGGARYFVSIASSPSLTDGTTVQLAVPVDGITVESGNDGPIDLPVGNDEQILLSTAALLATLDIEPNASTVSDVVTVTMTVRNLGDSTIVGVAPSALTPDTPSILSELAGPSPAAFDLATGQQKTFTWTYTAATPGAVRLTGNATGTEQGTGLLRQSLAATSDIHQVFLQAQELEVFPVESMPFSINRGQTDVVPLSLTFTNNAGAGGSDIELLGLRIRLEDGGNAGVVADSLLSRIVVNEGTSVYLDKSSFFADSDTLDLTLATPALIPASAQVTLSLSLDIADSTTVPEFRIVIPDSSATWFTARDATSQAPVSLVLAPTETYPITSGLARIVAEATELDVSATGPPPAIAGQGQKNVPALDVQFLNPDPDSLAADVRVSSFEVVLTDSAGAAIGQPSQFLERLRVTAGFQTLVDRPVGGAEDSTMALLLSPLLSVPVNNPVPLRVEVDLLAGAPLGSVRMRLADSTGFDARDANTGSPLPAVYATDPVAGGVITVVAPADTLLVAGAPLFPATVPVGTADQPALRIAMRHPGGPSTGDILIESLTVQCRGQAGQPLVPATFVDRARLMRDSTEVGLVTGPPTSGGEFLIGVGTTLAPGQTDTLELWVDVEVTAPAIPLRLDVGPGGVAAVDAGLATSVAVAPDSGAMFPLTSGLTQLESPARDLVVSFADAMPPVLTAQSEVMGFASLTLSNPADPTAGTIEVDALTIRASDADGNPIDVGSAVVKIEAWKAGALWAEADDIDVNDGKAVLSPATPLVLDPQEPATIEFRARYRPDTPVTGLRLGLDQADIGVVQPQSSLLTIAVSATEGQQFPFWTLAGNFSAPSLEESWSNFPNPFAAGRAQTNFAFFLTQPARVSLKLYTARGALVKTLLDQAPLAAGLHQDRAWDGRNGNGSVVVNGVYLAEIAVQYDNGSIERYLRKVAVVR